MTKIVNKIIYLPVEFKLRELDSKLALSLKLLSKGYSVVIGQQWEIYANLKTIPPGIILFKSHNRIHYPAMKIAKESGHIVAALEEEAMALTNEKALGKCSTKELYEACDFILATGEFEKNYHIQKNPKSKIVVVGNPRVDLLKNKYITYYQHKINSISSMYKDYVIINTNFTISNSNMGNINQIANIFINAGLLDTSNSESVEEFNAHINWEQACLKEMTEAINNLTIKFKKINFIVRPHPAENIEKARSRFNNLENLRIIRDGSHLPWTLGSLMLIHPSCTTGLEAAIAGKESISLNPFDIWYSNSILSNQINKVVRNYKELIDSFDLDILNKKKLFNEKIINNQFKKYIDNIDSSSSLEKIASFLEGLSYSHNKINMPDFLNLPRMNFQLEKCLISKDEIYIAINKLKKIEGDFFSNKEIKINALADSLFFLTI